ncbi:Ig-like domain-containing protein [Phenylobacterium sp.]|jgi:VCBS repeat-containing protein|uniref:Ig-like domain-containing protein n=1 Tax=Phenylobacterium sp. TaxID=1871053 RepID=UPI002F949625
MDYVISGTAVDLELVEGDTLLVTRSGHLYGLGLRGNGAEVQNSGAIDGVFGAGYVASIINHGTILSGSSFGEVISLGGGAITNGRGATITGASHGAIVIEGAFGTDAIAAAYIINEGDIGGRFIGPNGLEDRRGDINIAGSHADVIENRGGQIFGDISTQGGADVVTNNGYIKGEIRLGDGDDRFSSSLHFNGRLDGGSGADTLVITGSHTGEVHGGGGDDHITLGLGRNASYINSSVDAGEGDDTVVLEAGVTLESGHRITGGAGYDSLVLKGRFDGSSADPLMFGERPAAFERLVVSEGSYVDAGATRLNLQVYDTVEVFGRMLAPAGLQARLFHVGAGGHLTFAATPGAPAPEFSGAGRVSLDGPLVLNQPSGGFSGELVMNGGAVLQLGDALAAGSGAIVFGSTSGETLVIDPAALASGGLAASLRGFSAGDSIQLAGVSGTTATLGTNNVLTIHGTFGDFTIRFDPAENLAGGRWSFSPDGRTLSYTPPPPNVAPVVSGPVTGAAQEDEAPLTLDALANATDANDGQILTVVGVPTLPAGVTYDARTHSFTLDPNDPTFDRLPPGVPQVVTVSYGVSDGVATPVEARVELTVIGVNDIPTVTGPVAGFATEGAGAVTLSALSGATDADDGAVLAVVDLPVSLPAGVTYDAAGKSFTLDPSHAAYNGLAAGGTRIISISYGVSDGTATTRQTASWTLTGTNDAPNVAAPLTASGSEGAAAVTLSALAGAADVDDGAVLSVVDLPASLPAGVTYDAASKSFTLDPSNTAYDSLAVGQSQTVTVAYGVSDGTATVAQTVSWTVTGANDAPLVAGTVTGSAAEGGAPVTLSALHGASDPDTGAVLSVGGLPASLPDGVSYDPAAQTFRLDPSHASYNSLAAGQTRTVSVTYGVTDGSAATPQTVTWTLTGTNDAPTAVGDTAAVAAHQSVTIDVLTNDSDPDGGDTKTLVSVSSSSAGGHAHIVGGQVTYVADAAVFANLPAGQTATDSFRYVVRDAAGAQSTATVTVTVTGAYLPPVIANGGNGGGVLNGQGGHDRLSGGNGADTVNGLAGDDSLSGGNGSDLLSGGVGRDSLSGGNGGDTLNGGAGDDRLTGGNGADRFVFQAGFGRDVVTDFGNGDQLAVGGLFTSFAQVMAHARQVGDDVVITYDAANVLTLEDVTLASFRSGDFLFS